MGGLNLSLVAVLLASCNAYRATYSKNYETFNIRFLLTVLLLIIHTVTIAFKSLIAKTDRIICYARIARSITH